MLNQTDIQMVFFDAAGTLFEVRGSVGEVYARVARRYGIEAAPAEIERGFVRHFHDQPPMAFPSDTPETELLALERDWWRRLVRAVFADRGPFPRFDDYFAEIFELFRGREGWAVYPDVEPALVWLKERGVRVGMISNFDSRLFDVLRAFSLDRYFDAIHISSREGAAKPDPAIFRAALEKNSVPPDRALHVGDSWRDDAEAATKVGMRAVWLDRQGRAYREALIPRITSLDQLAILI